MATAELISDGILRLHGPSGGVHDFDPLGPVCVEVTTEPRKGKFGVRVSIAGKTANYSMKSRGEAAAFAREAVRIIKNFE